MDATASLPDSMVRVVRFLRAALAPSPWRINIAMRCVLASAIVIVVSMTLQVPALPVSLIAVFYTTQSNAVITRLAGVLFMVAATLGTGIAMVLLIVTFDHPFLRIVAASVVFFISAYLMRILKVGMIFFIVAIVVIYLQSLVDQVQMPEAMVRLTLWVWVSLNYAILVALVVNTLLLPIEPERQFKAELHRQLGDVGAALLRLEQGAARVAPPGSGQALTGMLTLQKLLKFVAMRDKGHRADMAYQLALIAAVARLVRGAGELATAGAPAPSTATSIRQLRSECAALYAAVQEGTMYRLAPTPPPMAAANPAIADMWRTLAALSDLGAQQAPAEGQGEHEEPMVAPDALTNPVYLEFALKTLMAVLIGYVFYNAVHWQGIHTVMLTCLIVALPSLGASTQKAVLRIGGALVGSALALFAVVFVIPWLDSIAGLLLITMPVIGLGAWIAAGSERISYAGVQLVFTFALAVLERFGPTTDMTEIRDRLVGILLGVILAGAIQTLVWPEGEGGALRRKLAELLRSVATLMRSDAATAAPLAYAQQQMRAWTDFGTTQAMLARVAIEPDWREDTNELLTVRAQAVLASTRELIRADEALHAQLAVEEPEPQARAAADTARAAVADELEQYAAGLQAEPPSARKPPVAPAMMPQAAAGAAPDLLRHLDGLPDWTGRAPAPEPVSAPAPS